MFHIFSQSSISFPKLYKNRQSYSLLSGKLWGICRVIKTWSMFYFFTAMSQVHHGVSNNWQLHCLFNCLLRCTSKRLSSSMLQALCEGNPPVTGGFPSQSASNEVNTCMRWHQVIIIPHYVTPCSIRDHFVYAPSQWDMVLQWNVDSHWLGTYTRWSLYIEAHYI